LVSGSGCYDWDFLLFDWDFLFLLFERSVRSERSGRFFFLLDFLDLLDFLYLLRSFSIDLDFSSRNYSRVPYLFFSSRYA
jgi:hypothetical protein